LLDVYNRCPYSLCEVIEVKPGIGMTIVDLLRRRKYEIVERSASQTVKRGQILYCAPTQLAGINFNVAMSPYALRPIVKRDVLELRDWMTEEIGTERITTKHLLEFEGAIRGLYLYILKVMFRPPQILMVIR